jgi:signal transduction histidine kinase
MEAEAVGLASPKYIIGKTDYDLSWKSAAEILQKTDQRIIKTEISEEVLEYVTLATDKEIIMLTRKSPLYDDKNNVIGIIGVSIDITDRKRAEELELQNKLQRELYTIAERVAHDIASPVSALKMMTNGYLFKNISEEERNLLNSTVASIERITKTLLERYKLNNKPAVDKIEEQYFCIDLVLTETLNIKKYQYKESNVTFNYLPDLNNRFVFIKGNNSDFSRMISNVINNSVEAVEGKESVVDIGYNLKDNKVEIRIKDNGKGMPKEMVDKIMNNISIGTVNKENGHVVLVWGKFRAQ